MRVKIKREIVALGREDIKPFEKAGNSVKPSEWNNLILNPDVTIIDTRNESSVKLFDFTPGETIVEKTSIRTQTT